jgi:hypothetical protein
VSHVCANTVTALWATKVSCAAAAFMSNLAAVAWLLCCLVLLGQLHDILQPLQPLDAVAQHHAHADRWCHSQLLPPGVARSHALLQDPPLPADII